MRRYCADRRSLGLDYSCHSGNPAVWALRRTGGSRACGRKVPLPAGPRQSHAGRKGERGWRGELTAAEPARGSPRSRCSLAPSTGFSLQRGPGPAGALELCFQREGYDGFDARILIFLPTQGSQDIGAFADLLSSLPDKSMQPGAPHLRALLPPRSNG